MGWSIGYDERWQRDIGYGVPARCDHPDCTEEIDRGLAYVCGGEPYGGEYGCGLYFCGEHLQPAGGRRGYAQVCVRCRHGRLAFTASPDVPEWLEHKLTHESWALWRGANPREVAAMRAAIRPETAKELPTEAPAPSGTLSAATTGHDA